MKTELGYGCLLSSNRLTQHMRLIRRLFARKERDCMALKCETIAL